MLFYALRPATALFLLAAGPLLRPNEAARALKLQGTKAHTLLLRGGDARTDNGTVSQPDDNLETPVRGAVQADFVRKCTVALSVQDDRLLPLKALEEFCRSTGEYMECKLKLVLKLEAVHKTGGSIPAFCGAVYDWFQQKYGMLCPFQCRKLQCRSTCQWLEEHKKLNSEAKELKAQDFETSLLRGEIQKARQLRNAAEEEVYKSNRTANTTAVKFEQAQAELADRTKYVGIIAEKVGKLEKRIASLEESLGELTMAVTTDQDELETTERELDKVQLQHNHLMERGNALGMKIVEETRNLEDLPTKVDNLEAELEERVLKAAEMMKRIKQIELMIKDQEDEVSKWGDAYQKAGRMLREARRKNSPPQTVSNFEDLQRQQEERFRIEVGKLKKVKHYLADKKAEANHATEDIEALDTEINDVKAESQGKAERIASLIENLQKVEEEAQEIAQGQLADLVVERGSMQKRLGDDTEEFLHINRTLTLVKEVHGKDEARLREYVALETKARDKLMKAKESNDKAMEASNNAYRVLEDASAKEQALEEQFALASEPLVQRIRANEKALRELHHWKPEIVTQHGLGLLQPILGW